MSSVSSCKIHFRTIAACFLKKKDEIEIKKRMRVVLRGEHPFLHPFRSITKSLFFFNSPKCSAKTLPIVSSKKTQGFLRCIAMATTTTTTTAPVVHQVKERIELTEIERKIFDRLLATLRHYGLTNQLRVAGGWVRDKVLTTNFFFVLNF